MIVPLPTDIDPSGEAQTFAGLASRALIEGETHLAREYHDRAGRVYERQVLNLRKRSDKDALRYLAATQYYLGGFYEKAQHLCRKIQADMLPNRFRGNYPDFVKAVSERAKPDYAQKIRERLGLHLQHQEYQQALELLKEHQYVIEDEANLAELRGFCCERMGNYQGAAIFSSDAVRKTPNDTELIFMSTMAPLSLSANNKLNDAWEYVEQLLICLPHALTYLAASAVRFKQAVFANNKVEKDGFHLEQIQLFSEAEKRFLQLPLSQQQEADYRELMTVSFTEAVIAYVNIGQESVAQTVLDRAARFAPEDPFLRTLATDLKAIQPQSAIAYQAVLEREKQFTLKHPQEERVLAQLAA